MGKGSVSTGRELLHFLVPVQVQKHNLTSNRPTAFLAVECHKPCRQEQMKDALCDQDVRFALVSLSRFLVAPRHLHRSTDVAHFYGTHRAIDG